MTGSSSSGSNAVDRTDKTTLPGATAEELELRKAFGGLSSSQINLIMNEIQRQSGLSSPYDLALADRQNVDIAFNAAQQQLDLSNKDFADFSSGGRGLRMSDSPIADQSFQRQALGQSALGSAKAQTLLDAGLAGNQYRTNAALGLGGAVPGAGAFNLQNYLQERMAQPTTRSTGFGSSAAVQGVSGLQTAAQLAGGIGALGMGAAAAGGLFSGGTAATLGVAGLGLA